MKFLYFESVEKSGKADQIRSLMTLADREFIPPLSARSSPTQADLASADRSPEGIAGYYATMASEPVVLALEGDRILGFMAFKTDYTCEQIAELPNLYASTCVVHPDARGRGLMKTFYGEMARLFPGRPIFTRTWGANAPHFRVLEKLGFAELTRLKDHRGPGMDTVYFRRPG